MGSRPAGEPGVARFFGKVTESFGGMKEWKDGSGSKPADLDKVADFVATFASIPEGQTTADWLKSPEIAKHAGREPFVEECGTCHVIEGLTKGGMRRAPNIFRLGITLVDRPHDPQPAIVRQYGFLTKNCRARCPLSATTRSPRATCETLIRYLKGDFPSPLRPRLTIDRARAARPARPTAHATAHVGLR